MHSMTCYFQCRDGTSLQGRPSRGIAFEREFRRPERGNFSVVDAGEHRIAEAVSGLAVALDTVLKYMPPREFMLDVEIRMAHFNIFTSFPSRYAVRTPPLAAARPKPDSPHVEMLATARPPVARFGRRGWLHGRLQSCCNKTRTLARAAAAPIAPNMREVTARATMGGGRGSAHVKHGAERARTRRTRLRVSRRGREGMPAASRSTTHESGIICNRLTHAVLRAKTKRVASMKNASERT